MAQVKKGVNKKCQKLISKRVKKDVVEKNQMEDEKDTKEKGEICRKRKRRSGKLIYKSFFLKRIQVK